MHLRPPAGRRALALSLARAYMVHVQIMFTGDSKFSVNVYLGMYHQGRVTVNIFNYIRGRPNSGMNIL